jgi:N-acyl-phosphatidylethanolamine-hydrolysing phospholipase D
MLELRPGHAEPRQALATAGATATAAAMRNRSGGPQRHVTRLRALERVAYTREVRLALPLLLTVLAVVNPGCQGTGAPKTGAPPHHLDHGFRNLNPSYARPNVWTRWGFVIPRLLRSTFSARAAFPVIPNDGRSLRENRGVPIVTWIGHSTVLVQLDGANFLTDPQWSERASPLSFAGPRRVVPPGLRLEDLPPIDFVLISHDHYDHLDAPTVKRLWAAHRPRFLVPLGLKAWFAELGIDAADELDWWDTRTVKGLTIVCLPNQHWSGRTLRDQNRRLWAGWAVLGRDRRFYFAGDTGYYAPIFQEIGRRFGPFDLGAIPIGAYMPRAMMRFSHLTPEEALQVFADIGARRLLGIHWGTFNLASESLDEPPVRTEAEERRLSLDPERIWILRHGETRAW